MNRIVLLLDSDRRERVDVEGADLHVSHAAPLQRDRGLLSRTRDLLRTNEAVVLVLDLEEVRIELAVLAVDDDPDVLVRRVRGVGRPVQGADVVGG